MSTAVPMPDDTFSWPVGADGEEAYGYVPTNAGGTETANETRPGWFAFAMMATLTTTADVTPAVALESLAGTGGSIDNLVNDALQTATRTGRKVDVATLARAANLPRAVIEERLRGHSEGVQAEHG